MNLAETIEKAINTKDWSLVCLAYENLTGKKIEYPITADKTDSEFMNDLYELINRHKPRYCETQRPESLDNIRKKKNKKPYFQAPIDREPTPTLSPPPKNSHYGNTTVFVTEEATAQEIETNKIKNEISITRKVKRSPIKKYDVVCDECQKPFKSERPKTEDMGIKCHSCIKTLIRSKGKENDDPSNG